MFYVQDFPLLLGAGGRRGGLPSSPATAKARGSAAASSLFRRTLETYFTHAGGGTLHTALATRLAQYDYTSASVQLVASVPGQHPIQEETTGITRSGDIAKYFAAAATTKTSPTTNAVSHLNHDSDQRVVFGLDALRQALTKEEVVHNDSIDNATAIKPMTGAVDHHNDRHYQKVVTLQYSSQGSLNDPFWEEVVATLAAAATGRCASLPTHRHSHAPSMIAPSHVEEEESSIHGISRKRPRAGMLPASGNTRRQPESMSPATARSAMLRPDLHAAAAAVVVKEGRAAEIDRPNNNSPSSSLLHRSTPPHNDDLSTVTPTNLGGRPANEPVTVKVIFPSENEVKLSVEGWRSGLSIPVHVKNFHELVNQRLHRWGTSINMFPAAAASLGPPNTTVSERRGGGVAVHRYPGNDKDEDYERVLFGRNRAMPHMKTYAVARVARIQSEVEPRRSVGGASFSLSCTGGRLPVDDAFLECLVVTSANLSMAAWGQLQGGGTAPAGKRAAPRSAPTSAASSNPRRRFIRSFELGVVLRPSERLSSPPAMSFSCTPEMPIRPLGRLHVGMTRPSSSFSTAPPAIAAAWAACHPWLAGLASRGVFMAQLGSASSVAAAAARERDVRRCCHREGVRGVLLPYDIIQPVPYASTERYLRDGPHAALTHREATTDVPWAVDFPHTGADSLRRTFAQATENYSHYGQESWLAATAW